MRDVYQALLRDFAEAEGLDPDALCQTEEIEIAGLPLALAFEGGDNFGDVIYVCGLGPVPAERADTIHRRLLEANHLWSGTGGATLGLQPGTGAVVLCGRSDLESLTAEDLATVLEGFVDIALQWRHIIHEAPLSTPESTPEGISASAFA